VVTLEGVEMIESKCPDCGHGVFGLAKACPRCGAPRGRLGGVLVAGALVLLLVAAMVALVTVLRGDQLAAATETGAPADEHIAAGSMADLSWLATAMRGCDAEARAAADRLIFLVTPLTPVVKDIAPWHAKSINDMGNGILLRSDDTLEGLKSGALRFYPADYAFRILDQASETIYKWRPSRGVAKFSTAEAGPIATFKVQFRTAHSGSDNEWGGSFTRQNGACHWVNAIINN
jgi:ribosomal protein S27AE